MLEGLRPRVGGSLSAIGPGGATGAAGDGTVSKAPGSGRPKNRCGPKTRAHLCRQQPPPAAQRTHHSKTESIFQNHRKSVIIEWSRRRRPEVRAAVEGAQAEQNQHAKMAVLASFFAVLIEHLFVEKGVETVETERKTRYRVAKNVESLPSGRNFFNLRRFVRSAAAAMCDDLPTTTENPRTKWQAAHVKNKWQCCVDEPEEKRLRLLATACGVSRYQLVRGCLLALLEEAEKGGVFDDVDLGPRG